MLGLRDDVEPVGGCPRIAADDLIVLHTVGKRNQHPQGCVGDRQTSTGLRVDFNARVRARRMGLHRDDVETGARLRNNDLERQSHRQGERVHATFDTASDNSALAEVRRHIADSVSLPWASPRCR